MFLITTWPSKIVKRSLWPSRLEHSFQTKILCSIFSLVLAKLEQFGWKLPRHTREIWSSQDLTLLLTLNLERTPRKLTTDHVTMLKAFWFCSSSAVQLNMQRKSVVRLDRYHKVIPRMLLQKWAPISLRGYHTHNICLFNHH